MRDPLCRTKVVVRHLPPSIPQTALLEQIDSRFAGRYKWFCFRPGKISAKIQKYSRVYFDLQSPEDVLEFAEFFDGHVFVNEKGAQYKTIVEYAPSQRVPKPWTKKDGREGTIFKDPEYLEFLDLLAKPAEYLPSAEIQLERKEAERAGAPKEVPIVTPLMDFVRQRRAVKSGTQRTLVNGKLSRRAGGASSGSSTRRNSEKRRVSTSVYVLRDSSSKSTSSKEKPTYLLMPRRDEQLSYKSGAVITTNDGEPLEDDNVTATDGATTAASGSIETGKRKVILLKGRAREISNASSTPLSQSPTSPVRNSLGSTAFKQNQRREAPGRIIRSILTNKDPRPNQSFAVAVQAEHQQETVHLEKERRPPRPSNIRSMLKDHVSTIAGVHDCDAQRNLEERVISHDLHTSTPTNEKQERRMRNKDRPDRGVWTLRRSDGSHPGDESSSSTSLRGELLSESVDGASGVSHSQQVASGVGKVRDIAADTESSTNSTGGKSWSLDIGFNPNRIRRGANPEFAFDIPSSHGETKSQGSGRGGISTAENGSHRHVSRRGLVHGPREVDNFPEGKPSKRGGGTGYSTHEKQVWVQKSGSGS